MSEIVHGIFHELWPRLDADDRLRSAWPGRPLTTARRDSLAARGEVHLLPAATSTATNPLDFRETARLINDGYELAAGWLMSNMSSAEDVTRAAYA